MRKTLTDNNVSRRLAVDTKELQSMLCCGRDTAVKIGTEANSRIQIGKRVLWNVEKVQEYINDISTGE